MSQQRQNKMVVTNNGDTTYTKIFVGGLAWETQRDTMRRYFEQFGEILEAVVITDKNTGRSKGYGFVSLFLFLSILWLSNVSFYVLFHLFYDLKKLVYSFVFLGYI